MPFLHLNTAIFAKLYFSALSHFPFLFHILSVNMKEGAFLSIFKGAGTALVTPFKGGNVDWDSLNSLLQWQLDEKIDAIISCGTTGEASTLKDDEHIEVVKFTVNKVQQWALKEHDDENVFDGVPLDKRIPVIAGAGSNDTAHAIEMAQTLEKLGIDGLLLVTPYYNKCSQKGLIKHYEKIADSVKIPCILYSVPGRTGVNILPDTVFYLADHPNIIGIKEASGDISQVCSISRAISESFDVYSGNDDMTVPMMALGAAGCISTASNIVPNDVHMMTHAYLDGDTDKARKMQLSMKPLIDALFADVNPVPVKAALSFMGKIQPEYRLPLCETSNAVLFNLMSEMKRYGLTLPEL